jgi:hypothetical protein
VNSGVEPQLLYMNMAWQYLHLLRKYFDSDAETIHPRADGDFHSLNGGANKQAVLRDLFMDCGCFPAFTETANVAAGRMHTTSGIGTCTSLTLLTRGLQT